MMKQMWWIGLAVMVLVSGAVEAKGGSKKGGGKGTGKACGRGYISSADTCHIGSGSGITSSSFTLPPPLIRPSYATAGVAYFNLGDFISELGEREETSGNYVLLAGGQELRLSLNSSTMSFRGHSYRLPGTVFTDYTSSYPYVPVTLLYTLGCGLSGADSNGLRTLTCHGKSAQQQLGYWVNELLSNEVPNTAIAMYSFPDTNEIPASLPASSTLPGTSDRTRTPVVPVQSSTLPTVSDHAYLDLAQAKDQDEGSLLERSETSTGWLRFYKRGWTLDVYPNSKVLYLGGHYVQENLEVRIEGSTVLLPLSSLNPMGCRTELSTAGEVTAQCGSFLFKAPVISR